MPSPCLEMGMVWSREFIFWVSPVFPLLHEYTPSSIHTFGDIIVFYCRFHIGSLLRLYEFLTDIMVVEELDHIHRLSWRDWMEGRDGDRIRIDLDHDIRIVGEPDGTIFRELPIPVFEAFRSPGLIDRSDFGFEVFPGSYRLYVPVLTHSDLEILERHHLRESWMEWSNMIVITIHLHEALPVVVTGVIFAMMVSIRFEIHDISIPDICEILRDIMLPREEKSSPVLERPCAQMHTRIDPKMWSPPHLTLEIP